ncbi:hypothetical protein AVEN_43772-1, partial [Araneus ventricosus]
MDYGCHIHVDFIVCSLWERRVCLGNCCLQWTEASVIFYQCGMDYFRVCNRARRLLQQVPFQQNIHRDFSSVIHDIPYSHGHLGGIFSCKEGSNRSFHGGIWRRSDIVLAYAEIPPEVWAAAITSLVSAWVRYVIRIKELT